MEIAESSRRLLGEFVIREHCLSSFDTGVYLFDLKTMEAKILGSIRNGSVYSY